MQAKSPPIEGEYKDLTAFEYVVNFYLKDAQIPLYRKSRSSGIGETFRVISPYAAVGNARSNLRTHSDLLADNYEGLL